MVGERLILPPLPEPDSAGIVERELQGLRRDMEHMERFFCTYESVAWCGVRREMRALIAKQGGRPRPLP